MKEWLSDAIEQIALGQYLATTQLGCGKRFGLIAVDNAVEYALISYVESDLQIVGKSPPSGIGRRQWDDKKRVFPELLEFVCGLKPELSGDQADILNSHNLRNDLYHSGRPITVGEKRVTEYAKLARSILITLFSISYSEGAWASLVESVATALSKATHSPIRPPVDYEVNGSYLRFLTPEPPTAKQAIAIVLLGYATRLGSTPTKAQLAKSLELSSKALNEATLTSRLTDMRREGWLQKAALKLNEKAIRALRKRFTF